jgi:hypothetical protein
MTNIQKVSADLIRKMAIGESVVFTETPGCRNAGSQAQSYAIRAGASISTTHCLIVIPSTLETIKAVIVTKHETLTRKDGK